MAALDRLGGSDWFRAGVTDIRGRIAAGDGYQVNLTDSFAAPFDGDPLALYAALARAQRGSYHAYLDLGGTVIASASPELFVRWTDGVLESRPMKGTRPRGPDAAADAALATELHASAKDRAENVMIVDLIRNDLSRLAELGSVEVPELFAIERYETVWQMTSTVRCRPRAEVGLADVFAAMFPCGSVTGAPKVAAMRIIDELEPFPRWGRTAGPSASSPRRRSQCGRASAWPSAPRVVDRAAGRVRYGAGGGITWDSDPVAEDAEAVAKTAILRHPRPVFRLLETMRWHDGEVLRWPLIAARWSGRPRTSATTSTRRSWRQRWLKRCRPAPVRSGFG
ncbi:MAG: chorismate-binding protein [Microthrixaceae bacterium]